ncbi:hypothetical protein KZZ52_25260 [Dactylosporangium sp. AC04546]|uniref:hypothetical protein n=1 Tax=Dactylosporangium sp. AC04546 TaxID=2862460 RepID=UPI001EE0A01B|nr:hypothetical protein [Dactylosporangium sp. AC04546]WVK88580.1 hypothetical protein KZZ52_25260 [Dactylosporangium sp. AC04546]
MDPHEFSHPDLRQTPPDVPKRVADPPAFVAELKVDVAAALPGPRPGDLDAFVG